MKAAINGAINLSVLDGWWAEGFTNNNGWGIKPHDVSWDSDYRFPRRRTRSDRFIGKPK
jgi:starch phosphorylase